MKFQPFLILSTIFFLSFNVWADCNHRLEVDPIVLHWNGSEVENEENVVIKSGSATNGRCNRYYVTFGKGGENVYARKASLKGAKISYNLYRNSRARNLLKELPEAERNNAIEGKFLSSRPNQIASKFFWFHVPEITTLPKAGVYRDRVRLKLYAHKLEGSSYESSIDMPIEIHVGPVISLSLLDEGRSFDEKETTHTMNFGTLTQGRVGRMDIRVKANLGHKLYMSSLNNGTLKHDRSSDKVTYEMTVAGRRMAMNGSATKAVLAGKTSGASPEDGTLYQVGVKIGNVSNKRAGNYKDVITVSVEAI